jgi:hypothetical protein
MSIVELSVRSEHWAAKDVRNTIACTCTRKVIDKDVPEVILEQVALGVSISAHQMSSSVLSFATMQAGSKTCGGQHSVNAIKGIGSAWSH